MFSVPFVARIDFTIIRISNPTPSRLRKASNTVSSSLAHTFKSAFEAVSGHAYIVQTEAEAAEIISTIVRESNAKRVAFAELTDTLIDAAAATCGGIEVLRPPYPSATALNDIDQVQVGVTGAQFGIAETGTLVEVAFDDTSRLVSALPRTYVGIVHARDLEPTLRGCGPRMTALYQAHPENIMISFISGPSRTGDIEMILTLGVHGPEHAHAIIITGENA